MGPLDHFAVPSSWGSGYAKLSKSVMYCADYRTVELGSALVTRLINPALSGDTEGKTWLHDTMAWD